MYAGVHNQSPLLTMIQTMVYLKTIAVALTSGLTCGILLTPTTTTSLPTTATLVVRSMSQATVI